MREYRKALAAMLMIMMLSAPVMAQDGSSPEDSMRGNESTACAESAISLDAGDAEGSDKDSGLPASAEPMYPSDEEAGTGPEEDGSSEAAPDDNNDVAGEKGTGPDEDGEKPEENENDKYVRYIFTGGPELEMKDGVPAYSTHGKYELVSITADKDAGKYKAGDEIPEEEIREGFFSSGTTVTYVFIKAEEDDTHGYYTVSAEAEYDGVWDDRTESIT